MAFPIKNEPTGFVHLIDVMISIAKRIRGQGIIEEAFSKPLPIIIHGLEMYELYINATNLANPNGEARQFLGYAMAEGFKQDNGGWLFLSWNIKAYHRGFTATGGAFHWLFPLWSWPTAFLEHLNKT